VLNHNHCVIIAQTVLPVRGVFPRWIGRLPKGELRSKVNQKSAGKRRVQRAPGETKPKNGRVYFVQEQPTGAIKIGFCLKQPEKRLTTHKMGNSNPLKLIGHVAGSDAHEKLLHRMFSACRMKGEWFSTNILGKVREILACTSLDEWLKRQAPTPEQASPTAVE
jgi:hypothetical protein